MVHSEHYRVNAQVWYKKTALLYRVYLGSWQLAVCVAVASKMGLHNMMCPSATIPHLNAMSMAPWRCHHYVSIQLLWPPHLPWTPTSVPLLCYRRLIKTECVANFFSNESEWAVISQRDIIGLHWKRFVDRAAYPFVSCVFLSTDIQVNVNERQKWKGRRYKRENEWETMFLTCFGVDEWIAWKWDISPCGWPHSSSYVIFITGCAHKSGFLYL